MTRVLLGTLVGKLSMSRLQDLPVLRLSTCGAVGCATAEKTWSSILSWDRSQIAEGFPGIVRWRSTDTRRRPVSANPAAFLAFHLYKIPKCVYKRTQRAPGSALARRTNAPEHTRCSSRKFLHDDCRWPFWVNIFLGGWRVLYGLS